MGKAPHPSGRVLDRRDRAVEPGPLLYAAMGVARGADPEIRGIPSRSRMGVETRPDRGRRPDRRLDQQLHPAADELLVSEVI